MLSNEKPILRLADVSGPDAVKEMVALYKAITGRTPTEAEMRQAEMALTGKVSLTVKPKKS